MKNSLAAVLVQEEDVEYNRARVKEADGQLRARDPAQTGSAASDYGL
ncbi:hypothetical protein HWB79_gp147 [Streptomyces phage LukeCage]|jgi:hypothetical protein|uniref:Uncharacterized protein n=2 Tax=Karimacvirus TaxID=2843400 RepID=A0A345M8S2_9CAUD|nr:hypothetical protein HWB77_gp144 [Streptomyces phage StarPlatinum]YP_009840064.1 hypothetical protein HWB79_gp147 [Streptomyces phage LukeCage]AXH66893.1 hypothetical protein SEA_STARPLATINUM_166 [Streptomyces phage StarPlatinum]AXH69664.1 hypothetical protein SEA_LUKECAGE_160 [Streptomyces phage LukeCage]